MPNPNASYQEELFREFSQGASARRRRFPSGISLAQRSFSISFEQMIFFGIAAIVTFVLIFSIGVERGKHLARSLPEVALVMPVAAIPPQENKPQAAEVRPQAINHKPQTAEHKPKSAEVPDRGYTLQIASFKERQTAEKTANELRTKGYQPFVVSKGEFSVIYVGKYGSSEEAVKLVKAFKKQYPDCFVRKW